MEILAPIELTDFNAIDVTRLVSEVTDEEVNDGIKRIADQNRPYAPKGEGAKAEKDDRITIGFVGSIDGVPFEGGSAEEVPLTLGSNTFIPGFEDQLIGIAAGEERKINVSFPANYPAAQLAGKAAVFDVTAKIDRSAGRSENR